MMRHLLMSNSQASDCYKKLLACAAECEFVSGSTRHTKSIERAKYPVFDAQFRYKIVHDAPILLLTSNFFTRIVHRLFIWHVPLSVNLWRHDKQCDNSGSTRRTKSIETANYSV